MFTALSDRERALLSNTDVLGYIQKENEEINIRAKAEGWTFWMTTAESIAADYNNVYDYLRDMQWSTFSDMYKESRGFRPRYNFTDWTLEDFEREIQELVKEAAERSAWEELEVRATIEEGGYAEVDPAEEAAKVWEDQRYDLQDRLSL